MDTEHRRRRPATTVRDSLGSLLTLADSSSLARTRPTEYYKKGYNPTPDAPPGQSQNALCTRRSAAAAAATPTNINKAPRTLCSICISITVYDESKEA